MVCEFGGQLEAQRAAAVDGPRCFDPLAGERHGPGGQQFAEAEDAWISGFAVAPLADTDVGPEVVEAIQDHSVSPRGHVHCQWAASGSGYHCSG